MPEREFEDDQSIPNEAALFRRIPPYWLTPDECGRKRVSSAAYRHFELSILIELLMREAGRPPEEALTGYVDHCLVSITAGLARKLHQKVVKESSPPNDPAHGLVVGKKTDSIASRLARESKWVVPAEPPTISTA